MHASFSATPTLHTQYMYTILLMRSYTHTPLHHIQRYTNARYIQIFWHGKSSAQVMAKIEKSRMPSDFFHNADLISLFTTKERWKEVRCKVKNCFKKIIRHRIIEPTNNNKILQERARARWKKRRNKINYTVHMIFRFSISCNRCACGLFTDEFIIE